MLWHSPSGKKQSLSIAIIALPLLMLSMAGSAHPQEQLSPGDDNNLPRLKPALRNQVSNAGWNYDAYPNLEPLDAGKTITLADIKGPAQINTIHITGRMRGNEMLSRSLVLEIFFDGAQLPAVSVPFGDFFADGTGRAAYFTTPFVEKVPDAYNCYIPMPFRKSARVTLRNDSKQNIFNYSYVEWQTLPDWDASLGYFHASWRRLSFPLTPDTKQPIFSLPGPGHLIGEYWNINTDEPEFAGMTFVMEGNDEHRVDGEAEPSINYLGSEDSFNFSWGWHEVFTGYKVGTNYLSFKFGEGSKPTFEDKEGKLSRLSTYRFRDRDVIRFARSLDLTINWTKEFRALPMTRPILDRVRKRNEQGGGWVDYAVTTYWYSSDPAGEGFTMPPIDERRKLVLRTNPLAQ